MARDVTFPRSRHVALSASEQIGEGEAKAEGAEAVILSADSARDPVPGIRLPEAAQPGAPGVPDALPVPPAPVAHIIPHLIAVDVSVPAGEPDACVAIDGTRLPVRCPSSLEGRQAAGDASARAAGRGEAVL